MSTKSDADWDHEHAWGKHDHSKCVPAETGEVTSVLNLRPSMGLSEAVHLAIGAASVCWEDLRETGEFDTVMAGRIAAELVAYVEGDDKPLVSAGDEVAVRMIDGVSFLGTLTNVFSGAGETDGMIQVEVEGEGTPRNVYERHILWLRRIPVPGGRVEGVSLG